MNFQAPVGGCISPVNEKYYEGGQFIPDTGLFCDIKKKAKRFARIERNWSDLIVQKAFSGKGYFVIAKYASSTYEKYLNKYPIDSQEEAVAFAREVLALRDESYRKSGFQPHQTRFLVL